MMYPKGICLDCSLFYI